MNILYIYVEYIAASQSTHCDKTDAATLFGELIGVYLEHHTKLINKLRDKRNILYDS